MVDRAYRDQHTAAMRSSLVHPTGVLSSREFVVTAHIHTYISPAHTAPRASSPRNHMHHHPTLHRSSVQSCTLTNYSNHAHQSSRGE